MAERLRALPEEEAREYIDKVHVVGLTYCKCGQVVLLTTHLAGDACPLCGAELPPALKVFQEAALA